MGRSVLRPYTLSAEFGKLEDFFLVTQIPEGTDVGNDEGDAELIVSPDLAEFEAAIFERQAAAAAVVADFHELVLQRVIGEVVAHARRDVESFARFAAVTDQRANLI